MMEYLSQDCGPAFIQEFSSHIGFCEDINQALEQATSEDEKSPELLQILEQVLTHEELQEIEQYHFVISKCLGQPVGLCKMYTKAYGKDKYVLESLCDR